MRITCEKCGAQYEVDDSRVSAERFRINCPACAASLAVGRSPDALPATSHRSTPLQTGLPRAAPVGATAPSAAATVVLHRDDPARPSGAPPRFADAKGSGRPLQRYHVKRRSGKTFGPFLEAAIVTMFEQAKLDGDEELSTDGRAWLPLSAVPVFARFAKPVATAAAGTTASPAAATAAVPAAAAPTKVVPVSSAPPSSVAAAGTRLSAPARPAAVPVPRAAAPAPDREDDLGLLDLPAPRGPAAARPLFARPDVASIDLPAPKRGVVPEKQVWDRIDLPATLAPAPGQPRPEPTARSSVTDSPAVLAATASTVAAAATDDLPSFMLATAETSRTGEEGAGEGASLWQDLDAIDLPAPRTGALRLPASAASAALDGMLPAGPPAAGRSLAAGDQEPVDFSLPALAPLPGDRVAAGATTDSVLSPPTPSSLSIAASGRTGTPGADGVRALEEDLDLSVYTPEHDTGPAAGPMPAPVSWEEIFDSPTTRPPSPGASPPSAQPTKVERAPAAPPAAIAERPTLHGPAQAGAAAVDLPPDLQLGLPESPLAAVATATAAAAPSPPTAGQDRPLPAVPPWVSSAAAEGWVGAGQRTTHAEATEDTEDEELVPAAPDSPATLPGAEAVAPPGMAQSAAARIQAVQPVVETLPRLRLSPEQAAGAPPPAVPPAPAIAAAPTAATAKVWSDTEVLTVPAPPRGKWLAALRSLHGRVAETIADWWAWRPAVDPRTVWLGIFVFVAVGFLVAAYVSFGDIFSGSGNAERTAKSALEAGRQQLLSDSFASYQRAAASFQEAAKWPELNDQARGLEIQAVLCAVHSAGADPGVVRDTTGVLAELAVKDKVPDFEVVKARGLHKMVLGQQREAQSILRPAADTHTADPAVHLYLGWSLFADRRWHEADLAFQRALSKEKCLTAAVYGHGRSRLELGDARGAKASFEAALACNPRHFATQLALEKTRAAEGKELGEEQLQQLIDRDGPGASAADLSQALTMLGAAAAFSGRLPEASTALRKALERDPRNLRAAQALGELLLEQGRPQEALARFEANRTIGGDDIDSHLGAVQACLGLDRFDDARQLLTQLQKQAPKNAHVRYWLGRLEMAQAAGRGGAQDKASELYQEAIALDPKLADAYADRARILVKQRKIQDAQALLDKGEQALSGKDGSAQVAAPRADGGQAMPRERQDSRVAATARATLLTARGETYLAAADLGRAEVALRTALAACPHLIPARYQLAVVLEKRGRELEARAILEAVAGKVRYYPGLTERLARLLQKAGDLKGAEATFERGLAEIRPSAAFRLAAAQFFFDIGRQARTRQILEALIVEGHGSADVYYLLGKAYAALGLWDNAAREFRRALFAEARPEFHLALARVHEQTRRGDEALVQYKQALDLRPDYDEARLARARLLTRRGARGEALRDLDILARHGEAGAAVYLLMGSCLADLRRLTRAIAAYETASRLDPRLGEPHYRLGQIYSGLERPAAAAAELSRAIALGDEKAPWYADALLLLGFAYRADHQRVLAIQAFRRYLAVAPSMAEGRSQAERELAFLTGGTE